MARAFIGIGPGRCGTQSLAKIVGACNNTIVTHEEYPSPWYEAGPNLGKLILKMRQSDELVGNVSCNLLAHVDAMRAGVPKLMVICLHRHKEEVVRSFSGLLRCNLRPVDRLSEERRQSETNVDSVSNRFPVIDAATKEQAWGFYWEMAETLMQQVKPPVKHVWTNSLCDDFTVKDIFDFLEIPICDRVLIANRRWNSTEHHLGGKKTLERNHTGP